MSFRWLFHEASRGPQDCLDGLDHEAWLRFVFEHPVPRHEEERWYNLEEAERFYFRDSERLLNHITHLFSEPEELLDSYSVGQVVQGFWCLVSGFELADLLKDPDIDPARREACLASLERLYGRLFSRQGFARLAFKYWRPLTQPFQGPSGPDDGPDRERLREAMFLALVCVLAQPEPSSFLSAAYGLVLLGHPRGRETLLGELARRQGLSADERSYMEACAKGQLLPCPFASQPAAPAAHGLSWLKAIPWR
jgi:hypothetical protein